MITAGDALRWVYTSLCAAPQWVRTSLCGTPRWVCTPLCGTPQWVCTSLCAAPQRVCASLCATPQRVCTSLCATPRWLLVASVNIQVRTLTNVLIHRFIQLSNTISKSYNAHGNTHIYYEKVKWNVLIFVPFCK